MKSFNIEVKPASRPSGLLPEVLELRVKDGEDTPMFLLARHEFTATRRGNVITIRTDTGVEHSIDL